MTFTDPIAFEEFLAPAGGDVRVRPMTGSRFRANIDMRMMKRIGLFTVDADSFSAQKAPQKQFYGLSIPLNTSFTVSELGREQTFGRENAHLLSPGSSFTFQSKTKCHTMVCNFFVDPLEEYKERIMQRSTTREQFLNPRVLLRSAAGNSIFRAVARAWSILGMENSSLSEITLQEAEDDLLACFILLTEESWVPETECTLPSTFTVNRAEDYICANLETAITRDKLADKAGVSIRSLSRSFEKKHGIGPMAFVRQRRLDASYARLRGSEPEATSVTEVANLYGFGHLGKFAISYKNTFGESPSKSLLCI